MGDPVQKSWKGDFLPHELEDPTDKCAGNPLRLPGSLSFGQRCWVGFGWLYSAAKRLMGGYECRFLVGPFLRAPSIRGLFLCTFCLVIDVNIGIK